MMARPLLFSLFVLLSPGLVQAQAEDRRASLRVAFAAADAGALDAQQATRLAGDPLYPWLQVTALAHDLAQAAPATVQPVLDSLGDSPAGRWLRPRWLGETLKREDWTAFRQAYRSSEDAGLRCAELSSRPGAGDEAWLADARAVWLSGKSLPDRCDAVFARMTSLGKLDDALRWQRVDLAIAEGNVGLLRRLADSLGPASGLVSDYANYIDTPMTTGASGWPADTRSCAVRAAGLAALAKRDPDRALQMLQALPAESLDAVGRGRVRYQIALWTVASYLPGAAERLAAVPDSAYDERLHEWRAREAISRGDDAGALAAILRMPPAQRADSRWQYFEARLRERLGQSDAAKTLYRQAAQSPSFHGWLAADRLRQPYALCPLEPSKDSALRARVSGDTGLQNALDLFALDRADPAAREWGSAIKAMDDDARRVAVQLAIAKGWFDRAVFGMNISPEDLRYYSLRFPLHHAQDIREFSLASGLDPAWVAGETRAESSFMPKARSGADARGLMQLQPATAQAAAKRIGLPWTGGESLYEPSTNLRLGAAELRRLLDRYDGFAYLAIAGYNAGPAPVDRWRAARGQLEPDFFIESIPWKETRDYVARVLAFSVVYDWRLNGNATALYGRMLGRLDSSPGSRRSFACPAPNPAKP